MTTFRRICAHASPLVLAGGLLAAPARADTFDHAALEALFSGPVTTSATGQPQRASEAPANMTIITADDIRRSGARDLPGVLRHVGGVDILEWGQGNTDVSIRGYNREQSQRVVVLIDGHSMYADFQGFIPWHSLPIQMEDIYQIEVVRGPNSALFGFNAVGGVINIVTRNPETNDDDAVTAFVGTQNAIGGAASLTFRPQEGLAFRLSAGDRNADQFDTPATPGYGRVDRGDLNRSAVNLAAVAALSDEAHLKLNLSYADADVGELVPTLAQRYTNYRRGAVTADFVADTSAGLVEVSVQSSRVVTAVNSEGSTTTTGYDNRATSIQVKDLFTLGAAHTLRVAGEYRRNRVETSPVGGAHVFYDDYAVSGMWNWTLSPSVSVTNAVRFDRLELGRTGTVPAEYPFANSDWDRAIEAVSFNSGLVWRVSEHDTLRFIASRGVKLPSLTKFGAVVARYPVLGITGAPDLGTANVDNFEVIWRRDLDSLGAKLNAGVFYQESSDLVGYQGRQIPVGSTTWAAFNHIGSSSAFGVEFGLGGEFGDGWRWRLDHRFEVVDDDFIPPTSVFETPTDYENTTPEHLSNANLGWSGGRWEIDGFVRHQSGVEGEANLGVPSGYVDFPLISYTAVDGRIGYALTDHVTLSLSGRNLGDDRQRQTAAPEVERVITGALTVRY